MTGDPEARLAERGLVLPEPFGPAATYTPTVRVGDLLFVSGQGPVEGGEIRYRGRLGDDVDIATGQAAAQLTMLNFLATVRAAVGSLAAVERFVRLLVFVRSTDDFAEHHVVANGASDLLADLYGPERGLATRAAVGTNALPFGVCVEIEGCVQVR